MPELVSNLAWGGEDFHTLFMTATHSVYTVKTKVGAAHRALYAQPRRRRRQAARSARAAVTTDGALRLDPSRCAMIIQDLQNDVIMEGGAFASSGSPGSRQAAERGGERAPARGCGARARRARHPCAWFIVEPGAPGMTLNAPLFEGVVDNKAMVRGSWGAAPVSGLEPRPGDFVVEKMRMSAWEGTRLETILRASGRDVIINTGAWTNMSVEHTARTARRQGLFRRAAGGLLLDHERRLAQRGDQLRAAECLGRHQDRCGDRGARLSRERRRAPSAFRDGTL